MAALRLEELSFSYPGAEQAVLRGLTLEIPAGGVFGLLGPNGAGKTTLVSILAGQRRAASGSAFVEGRVGLVPQEHAFYPMLTCRENLRFFGGVQGLQGGRLKDRVAAVAALARIESVLERRAGELSGGLKRRLNLAIGLLMEPEILLLDEPTVGVDPQSRAFLLETIRSLAGPQRIIVYTSHYMEEVQAICDRVAIIDHGELLVSGLLSEILEDGSGLLTLRLRAPLPDEGDARYELRISDTLGITQALDAVRAAGCEPLAIAYGERNLEQLFMQLTRRSLRD
jgi:ABC-2 type transport system ATP-binding protein